MKMSSIQMLKNYFGKDANEFIFKKAEKMFEQEITKAFDEGQEYEYQYHINNTPKFDSQTYFAETYGSKGSGKSEKPTTQTEIMYSEEDLREALFCALNIDRTTCCTTRTTDSIVREVMKLKQTKNK